MTCKQCRNMADCSFDAACNDAVFDPECSAKYCTGFEPLTNADRIRAMSDQELASFWADHYDEFCPNKPECGDILDVEGSIPDEWCVNCVLEWLRQPAKEEP